VTAKNFPDHFSTAAQQYARFRPRYPAALFDWLASLCLRRELAWDCATGSGQAALELARRFQRVVATDASEKQIAQAPPRSGMTYRVAPAEDSGLETETVDLVTVAQALHWFDRPRFYAEVGRILVPDGVIAVWSYQLAAVDERVDRVIRRLHGDIVGAYWPPERALVDRGYASLSFPFEEVSSPPFLMEETWDLAQLVGYLGTWSAVQRYREKTRGDAIERVRPDLEQAWGDPERPRVVRWPLSLRAGRK
jgi:SAM-dependent methyltransferase